jgi:hypothetical protein
VRGPERLRRRGAGGSVIEGLGCRRRAAGNRRGARLGQLAAGATVNWPMT